MDEAVRGDWLRSSLIEASAPFASRTDRVLGDGLPPGAQADFAPCRTNAEVRNWRMHDVTYLRHPGRAYRDGALVEATYREVFDADSEMVRRQLAAPHRRLDVGRVFCATNRFNANYYHQLVDVIPTVAAYAHDPGFARGLLLGPNEEYVPLLRAGLELAGVTPPPLLPPTLTGPLDIADLTFCSLLNGGDRPSLFCRSVYERMAAAAGPAGGPALIYVWRADSTGRPMRNEDDLVDALAGLGVTPVLLSALTLAEQVRLFRGARLVIGPHGAGLANVVFAQPGGVLYELLPSHYLKPHMSRLAELAGLHYWCDVHPAETQPGLWRHHTPWRVDIGAVLARVSAILRLYRLG
jgi:hypothetical protein